jgi:hypothetical protein
MVIFMDWIVLILFLIFFFVVLFNLLFLSILLDDDSPLLLPFDGFLGAFLDDLDNLYGGLLSVD